jgi:PDZ domain-containing protein
METVESDTYSFTFLNADDQEYTVDMTRSVETGLFGITFKMYYLVNEEATYPVFTQMPSVIGGPSGGLLSTLHIYNLLAEEDITHGLKIAGTGTINYDGTVGYIGGVRQKIITAYLNGVDVFFIPHLKEEYTDNYIEAKRVCEELKILDYESWLVPVATLEDALGYLATRGD